VAIKNNEYANERRKYSIRGTAFSFKKYCSSLVIVVKSLIFVRSDAEAPPWVFILIVHLFFYRRNSIANGLPSKATLCHVLQSIDDEKMTNRMSAFAEVFPQGNYGGTISFLFHFL